MKLSNLKTKATALVLALAVILSGLVVVPNQAEAATTDYVTILDVNGDAVANEAVNYNFNIANSTYTYIDILVPAAMDMIYSVTSVDGTVLTTEAVSSTDTNWTYLSSVGVYDFPLDWVPAVGDYTLSVTFTTNTPYIISIEQDKPALKLSHNSLVITKGFSSKLSVSNASGSIKWTSSKPSVAAVDSKGNVTGKKTGTAIITATAADGATASCAVSVKANTYTRSKMAFSDCSYGNAYIDVYNVSYNSKGDLVIKATFLNDRGYKIVKISSLKINVKNKSGKVIGTYSLKNKKVSILHGGTKTFTFTIKKSKLKQKKTQDLRNASVKPSWKYTYQQY